MFMNLSFFPDQETSLPNRKPGEVIQLVSRRIW